MSYGHVGFKSIGVVYSMVTTTDRIISILMGHPSPEISIVADNLIVCEFVPSHLVRHIRRLAHVDSVAYTRYRLIVHTDTTRVRVSDARITHVPYGGGF
jgi:hypothetical protein